MSTPGSASGGSRDGDRPGAGMGVDPAAVNVEAVSGYMGKAEEQTITGLLLSIISDTSAGALTGGQILLILFTAIVDAFVASDRLLIQQQRESS